MNAKLHLACLLATVLLVETCFALPAYVEAAEAAETSQDANDLDGRTSWLDTRNLEENFKELVYLSIQELVSEGKLNQQVIADRLPEEKRGRVEGWCFKKNKKTKKLVPYRCLKWVPDKRK